MPEQLENRMVVDSEWNYGPCLTEEQRYFRSKFRPKVYYDTCWNCGANLDPGEKCECCKEEDDE